MTVSSPYVVILSQGGGTYYIGYASPGAAYQYVATENESTSQALAATSQAIILGDANGNHVDELALTTLAY
jgi:hypothetical protein